MQQIVIVFFCLISFDSAFAQQWINTYAPNYFAKWTIESYDKGYVILGQRQDNQRFSQIIKTDINGNVLWSKKLGNMQYAMFANNVEITSDNGLVIGGSITKYDDQYDSYVLKLNACGELLWCSVIHTPTLYDIGWQVRPTPDNGYILLGELNDPDPDLRTNLFKFDSLGNLLWHQAYLPDSAAFGDDGRNLIIDNTGYLITAFCYYPEPGQTIGWERYYQIKTDNMGVKLWSNIYGKSEHYFGQPITSIQSSSGNYYSFGWHNVVNSSNSVPAMVKVMNNGTDSYNQDIISNVGTGGIGSVCWIDDSTFFLAGGWAINMYKGTFVFFKSDTVGNVFQTVYMDTISGGSSYSTKTFDGKLLTISTDVLNAVPFIKAYKVNSNLQYDSLYTHIYTYDSLCPHPIVSDTIDPDCGLIVDVAEPFSKPETHQLKIYPNPVSEKLTVIFPKYLVVPDNSGAVKSITTYHQWKSTTLEVYDLKGDQHMQRTIPKDLEQIELNVSSWPKGMYFFRQVYNKKTVAGEKVIVK